MDLICLGELLADMIEGNSEEYAKAFRMFPGGAAGNVAVGAAKQGLTTGVVSRVGKDFIGDFLIDVMHRNRVDSSRILQDNEHKSTLAMVSISHNKVPSYLFFRENAASLYMAVTDIDKDYLAGSRAVYFSSIYLTEQPSRAANYEFVRLAKECGALVAFDPNIRLRLWKSEEKALEEILRMLPHVDLLKLNLEELVFLYGGGEPEMLARRLMRNYPGIKLLAVTLGSEGAFLTDQMGNWVYSPAVPRKVLDTTGAGDAFFSALLYTCLTDGVPKGFEKLAALGHYANAAAFLTASRPGAIPALPTRAEILTFLDVSSSGETIIE